jgi:hypothetical protein
MDTSRSSSSGSWSAKALIFSGRSAPSWSLSAAQARSLVDRWQSLPLTTSAMPMAPALGYRGCVLSDGVGTEWRAHDGFATATSPSEKITRIDVGRAFELAIAASAPDGAIPPGVIA